MGDFVKRIENAYKLERNNGFGRYKIDKHIETFGGDNNYIMGGGFNIQVMGGGRYTTLDNSAFKNPLLLNMNSERRGSRGILTNGSLAEPLRLDLKKGNIINVKICDITVSCLLDTGSTISVVSKRLIDKIPSHAQVRNNNIPIITCSLANGTLAQILFSVLLICEIGGNNYKILFYVLPSLEKDLILGLNFMKAFGVVIDFVSGIVTISHRSSGNNNNKVGTCLGTMGINTRAKGVNNRHSLCAIDTDPIELIDLSRSNLTDIQRAEVMRLIVEYKHILADGYKNLEATPVLKYDIKLKKGFTGARLRPYRESYHNRQIIRSQIVEWEKSGIIERGVSDSSYPCTLVQKKTEGEFRFCIDHRVLNKGTLVPNHPFMCFESFLNDLGRAEYKYWSVLDLRASYMSVALTERTKKICSFVVEQGQYLPCRMTYGLSAAPATFSRLMEIVFGHIKATGRLFFFLDDILLVSETYDQHLSDLRAVFECISKAKLRIAAEKIGIAKCEVKFLGYILSHGKITPTDENIAKISNWPKITTKKLIRGWLGCTSFYRRFIPNYSLICKPLTAMLGKDIPFEWSEEAERSFQTLRRLLTSKPILGIIQINSKAILQLHTDASSFSIAYCLKQPQYCDAAKRVIVKPLFYGGLTGLSLNKAQLNYTVSEKELLAIVIGVKRLDIYLRGRPFEIYTDHRPLSFILHNRLNELGLSGRLARWAITLSSYQFTCIYVPGSRLADVDAISRIDHDEVCNEDEITDNIMALRSHGSLPKEPKICGFPDAELTGLSIDAIRQAQRGDIECQPLLDYLERGILPYPRHTMRKLLAIADDCLIINGTLYRVADHRVEGSEPQIYVPSEYRQSIIHAYHTLSYYGHLGHYKTLARVRAKFYWKGLSRSINDYIAQCRVCAEINLSKTPRVPLVPTRISQGPLQVVMGDLLSIHTPSLGYKYIFLLIDVFSKAVTLMPLRNKTARGVALSFFRHYIVQYGLPRDLQWVSDNGSEFKSSFMFSLSRLLGFQMIFTGSYCPQSNGQCERSNRSLLNILRKYTKDNPDKWAHYFPSAQWAINSSVNKSTGFSPFFLTHACEIRTPIDIACPTDNLDVVTDKNGARQLWFDRLRKARKVARMHLQRSKESMKEQYDQNTRPTVIKINDEVYIKDNVVRPGTDPKLRASYVGPYKVIRFCNPTNVYLENVKTKKMLPRPIHLNKIKRFGGRIHESKPDRETSNDSEVPVDIRVPEEPSDHTVTVGTPVVHTVPDIPLVTQATEVLNDNEHDKVTVQDNQSDVVQDQDHHEQDDMSDSTIINDETETANTGDFYDVDKVYRKRKAIDGGRQYFVKFKNYPKKYNMWTDEKDMTPELRRILEQRKLPSASDERPQVTSLSHLTKPLKQKYHHINNRDDYLSFDHRLRQPVSNHVYNNNTFDGQIIFYTPRELFKYYMNSIDWVLDHEPVCWGGTHYNLSRPFVMKLVL